MSFPEPPLVQRKVRSMSVSTSGGLLGGQNSRPHSAHSAQSASSNSSFDSYSHPPWPSSPPAPGQLTGPTPLSGPVTPNLLSPNTCAFSSLSETSGHSPGCRDRDEASGGYSRLLDRFKKLTLELELREVSVKQLQEELERSRESEARIETFLYCGSDSLRTSSREELIIHCGKQEIRVQQLEKKISELEFSAQSKRKLVAKRDDTIKSILNQMQSKTVELKQLQDFVSGASPMSPHHSQLEMDQSEIHLRLREKEKRVLELESEIEDIQVKVSELQRELLSSQTDKKRVVELEKIVNGLETKNKELGGLLQTRSQHIAHLEGSVAELSQLVAEAHVSNEPTTPDRTPPDPDPDPIISKLSNIVTSAEKMCTGGQGSSSLAAAQIALIRAELKEKNKILARQREQLNRLTELNTTPSPQIASWLDSKERENLQVIIQELNADKQQMTEQLVRQDVELNTQRLHITGLLTDIEVEKREVISSRDKSQELVKELEESSTRVSELEKIVETRGKKLNMYKRTHQAERVQLQQTAEAQKEMRGNYEEQLDKLREQLASETRRNVELSGALEDGVTVVLDREKELGEEKRFVIDMLSDLKLLSNSPQMEDTIFKQERKRIIQVSKLSL
ncbi:hypothetical protein LOD99_301 [Oopsacas minuta]|uniref:Uncharacterized protein n=1 Tax=Oopsacas minuta TaxID=111878 RepID=A0AAV7K8J5_9METZ|nr:hypothetical protein LOD99_301 [Oopsacas minuta]